MLNDTTNYDVWLEHSSLKLGYRIAKDENGSHQYSEGLAPFSAPQIFQGGYSYDSSDATVNVPLAIEDWSGGCGFTYVPGSPTIAKTMYASSSGIDASWRNRLTLLPEQQTGATTTQAPVKFVKSSLGTFCMTSRYVYKWSSSTWTQVFDGGSGSDNQDLIEYRGPTQNYLVLGVSNAPYAYSTDGTTWNQESVASIPAYRSSATASGTGTSAVITKPAGTADNDILIAIITHKFFEGGQPTPSGWTNFWSEGHVSGSPITPGEVTYYYWKRASSEGANYTFTWTTSSVYRGTIAAFSGAVTTGTPYEADGYAQTDAGATTTSFSVTGGTTTGANRLAVYLANAADNSDSATSWTPPTGYTEKVDSSAAVSHTFATKDIASSGTSLGTVTGTSSVSSAGAMIIWALIPASAGGSGAQDLIRFAVRGQSSGIPVLWAVNSSGNIRNTTTPATTTSWSAADTLIFASPETIKGLEVLDNVFYLYHSGGITSYNGTTVSTVWNNTTLTMESGAARPYTWVDQKTYFTFSGSLYRYDGINIEKMWPRSYQAENSSRTGNITAITGDERNLYFAIADTTPAYTIMKCDPNVEYTVNDETFMPVFEFTIPSSSATNAMIVVPGASDTLHSTNPQLVAGIGTSAHYFILPRNGKSPDSDSNYKFYNAASASLTGTKYDVGAKLFPKFINSSTVMVQDASTSYNSTAAATCFLLDGTTTTASNSISGAGIQTATFSTDIEFTQLRPDYTLQATNATDVVNFTGVVFNCSLNPPRKRIWNVVVEIDEDIELVGGGDSRYSAKTIRDHLFNSLTERVTFYGKDNTSYITRVLAAESVAIGTRKSQYKLTLVQLV